MNDILEAQALSYTFPGAVQALCGLHLSIRKGACLALLGPNGSGKSTFLLHLNGTLRPDSGQIRLDGAAVDYSRRGLNAWRSRVGLVLQDADDQLFAASVFEDISFGPLNQGLPPEQVRERVWLAMHALGVAALADRPPHMLSGGQKKRVAIAGAVVMQPEVLLLDEPTAGLDHEGSDQLVQTLQTLARQGMTIVFSTHDVDLARQLADDVALFAEGRIAAHGQLQEVLLRPDLLARAKLNPSLFLSLLHYLRKAGGLVHGVPLPRTEAELMQCLDRLTTGSEA